MLDKIFEVYKPVHEKIPTPDPKLMGVALKQLAATVPQASQLRVEDFTDGSLIKELESEGFIVKVTRVVRQWSVLSKPISLMLHRLSSSFI